MTRSFLYAGWRQAKEFLPSVIASCLMFGGLQEIISTLKYPLTGLSVGMINALIRRTFHDVMPLRNNYMFSSWQFEVKQVAIAVIVLILGSFVGLWVNLRAESKSNRSPASNE